MPEICVVGGRMLTESWSATMNARSKNMMLTDMKAQGQFQGSIIFTINVEGSNAVSMQV